MSVGIIPAGTANLLAGNLGIPTDLEQAVRIALDGDRRTLDLGVVNDEHFAVMAGTGLDALMMKETNAGLKDRVGQLAYVWTGIRAARAGVVKMSVTVDGATWFKGRASCLLFGNMGRLTGGLVAFPDARSDDGQLEIGVVTAATTAPVGTRPGPAAERRAGTLQAGSHRAGAARSPSSSTVNSPTSSTAGLAPAPRSCGCGSPQGR